MQVVKFLLVFALLAAVIAYPSNEIDFTPKHKGEMFRNRRMFAEQEQPLFNGRRRFNGPGLGRFNAGEGPGFFRRLSLLVGIPLPFSDEFRTCFKPFNVEFQDTLAGLAEDVTPEIFGVAFLSSASHASKGMSLCGGNEFASFIDLLVNTLTPEQMGQLFSDFADLVKALRARDWDKFSRDVADAIKYIIPLITCDSKACQVFVEFLRVLQVEARDFSGCKADIERFPQAFDDLKSAYKAFDIRGIKTSLDTLLRTFANVSDDCGLPESASIINDQAGKVASAVVSKVKDEVNIIIKDADFTLNIGADVKDIVTGWADENWNAVGVALSSLIVDVRLSSCQEDWCYIAQGLLDAASVSFKNLEHCKSELKTSFEDLVKAKADWQAGQYTEAIHDFYQATLDLSASVDSCGIPKIGKIIETAGTKLKNAKLQKIGQEIEIVVNGVDVYLDIDHVVEDLIAEKWSKAGSDLSKLVRDISKFNCDTEFCNLTLGFLQLIGIALPDIPTCEADLTEIKSSFEDAVSLWRDGKIEEALVQLATGIDGIANSLTDCDVDKAAKFILAEVSKLSKNPQIEKEGDKVVAIIIEGADLYDSIFDLVEAIESDNWRYIGRSLARIITDLSGLGCTSNACKVFTGFLKVVEDFVGDLAPCKSDVESSWAALEVAFKDVKNGDWEAAGKSALSGLLDVSHAVHQCHLAEVGADIAVIADLLHLAKVEKNAGEIVDIVVGGLSIIDDIHKIIIDEQNGDYNALGRDLGDLILIIHNLLHKECEDENGTVSTSCLVSNGLLMGLHILPDFKECGYDFKTAYNDLLKSVHYVSEKKYKKAAIEVGEGVHEIALGLEACDIPEIVEILSKVAAQLLGPEVAVVADVLHILINGIEITDDLYEMYIDYEERDWVKLGIDLAKLIGLLI